MARVWELIRDCLFEENDVDKKKFGLQLIECAAAYQELPSFILSTYQIVKILLSYYMGSDNIFYIRHSLSNTIIRLINNLVDPKRDIFLTVARIAKDIGLPQSLVTLRHESTHRNLPSLHILVLYANQALRWLKLTYWNGELSLSFPFLTVGLFSENILKTLSYNNASGTSLEYIVSLFDNLYQLDLKNREKNCERVSAEDEEKLLKKRKRKRFEMMDEGIKMVEEKSLKDISVGSLPLLCFAEVI
jgi:hypothetical protein